MDAPEDEVYDPWWDSRHTDDYTDELEWSPTRDDIPNEEKEDVDGAHGEDGYLPDVWGDDLEEPR